MSIEQLGSPFAEEHKEETPLNRFVQLLGFMKEYAVGEGKGDLLELPPIELKVKNDPPVLTRFFIYSPESSRYSPSIIMEAGQEARDPVTGRRVSGDIERTFVKKSSLKRSSAYSPQKHEQAEIDLAKIEAAFYDYRNTIEILRQSG